MEASIDAMEAELVELRKRRTELELKSKAICARPSGGALPSSRGLGPFPALHHLVDAQADRLPDRASSSAPPPVGIFKDPRSPTPKRPLEVPGPTGGKRRKLQQGDWAEFWQDVQPLTVPKDPTMEGLPTHISFMLSDRLPINVHGLFFHLASFGEVESVGVLSDTTCCAQFVRAKDAHRAHRACHMKPLTQMQTVVQVSGIDAAVAAKCMVRVLFQGAIAHANALILFEPSPYEDQLCALVHKFWGHAQTKLLQTARRRFLFFQFPTAADTHAALITLQLRLAFDWDIHVQYVSDLHSQFAGSEFRSTAEALSKSQPYPAARPAIAPPSGSHDRLRPLLRQIQVGARYKGVVRSVSSDLIHVDLHIPVRATVHVTDCDDPEAFRLLKVGDIIAPEVREVVSGGRGAPELRMSLQRPELCKPLLQRASVDALEQQKAALMGRGRLNEPAKVRLIYGAVRATFLQWAAQAVRDLQLANGSLEQFFADYPEEPLQHSAGYTGPRPSYPPPPHPSHAAPDYYASVPPHLL